MRSRLISIYSILLISCSPAVLIQFNEDEQLVEVFENLPGTKEHLYLKANAWMIETFNNAESVIQHTDKEEGAIIGRYLMSGELTQATGLGTVDSRVYAIIDIRVKDGKARIEIKPQGKWTYYQSSTIGGRYYNYSKEDAMQDMAQLSEGFYNSLLKDDIKF